jgi:hypothetical protein
MVGAVRFELTVTLFSIPLKSLDVFYNQWYQAFFSVFVKIKQNATKSVSGDRKR